jgi:predicted methyltransferase
MYRLQCSALALVLGCSSAPSPPANAPSGSPPAAPSDGQAPPGGGHAHGAEHTPGGGHAAHAHGAHGYHKDFSDAAAFSTHFDDPERDAWQRPQEVLDLLSIPPGSVVADLGAGTGYFVPGLSTRVGAGGQVLALDVEPQMVEFLNRRIERDGLTNVRALQVTPDDPGLAPGSVSRVLVVNTWHHIDARPSYAQKLRAALAPGGEVWVVDFTLEAERGPPAHHRLSAAQVAAELEQGGLRAQAVPESLPDQYIVRALR